MNLYVKYNLEVYEKFKERIENNDFDWWSSLDGYHMKCKCGNYCTRNNFIHFEKDPTRTKCWDCQMLNHIASVSYTHLTLPTILRV